MSTEIRRREILHYLNNPRERGTVPVFEDMVDGLLAAQRAEIIEMGEGLECDDHISGVVAMNAHNAAIAAYQEVIKGV